MTTLSRPVPLLQLLLQLLLSLSALALSTDASASSSQLDAARDGTPSHAIPLAWYDDVVAIAAQGSSDDRRGALHSRLAAAGLNGSDDRFVAKDPAGGAKQVGVNLRAAVSGNAEWPLLLLGAHYDQVGVGQGVTDNASGSAVVLALARRFQQRPLQQHRVAVAFWDLEESGLLGAKAYVAGAGERPALYVNFDVFGWGDTLWMMSPEAQHPLATATADVGAAAGLKVRIGDRHPPTDHLAFLEGGWPAVSYSLVDHDEIDQILAIFARRMPRAIPRVMQVIHSDRDTLAEVDAHAVETAIDAIEAALRAWDTSGSVAAPPRPAGK